MELIKQCPVDFGPELPKRMTTLLVKLVERRPAMSNVPDPAVRPVNRLRQLKYEPNKVLYAMALPAIAEEERISHT